MHDQNQPHQPPDELTQRFWQAWREQEGKSSRLAHLLLQRGRQLLDRFSQFYDTLSKLSRPAQRRWQKRLGVSLAGVALTLALSSAPVAQAYPPPAANALLNGTPCDLIEAIEVANTDTPTITCPATVSGADTITLLQDVMLYDVNNSGAFGNNGLPVIASEITIEGGNFTIARSPYAYDATFRILEVGAGGNLTLNNTTISGGTFVCATACTVIGGGILNSGTLNLSNSTVNGNFATNGGGIFNAGTLSLSNSTVSGNSALGGPGGGIFNGVGFTAMLSNSTVSGNAADNGGGIFNSGGAPGNFPGTLTLSNSTISGNTANVHGGGIYNGVTAYGGGTINLERSLVSGNIASGNGNEIYSRTYSGNDATYYGTINGNNFNLIGHDGNAGSVGFTQSGSDIVPSEALAAILGPLADNGGGTFTHALVAGSPAVDAAPTGPATDQRGVARPQGPAFDIGAFELEQTAATATPTDTATPAPTDTPIPTDTPTNTPEPPTATPTATPTNTPVPPTATPTNTPVGFAFSGFFQPVDNPTTVNTVNAGQAIPVKFSLGGNFGLNIFAASSPNSQVYTCGGGGSTPSDPIEETVTAGSSSLQYDPATNTYTYVWKTDKAWAGTCRQLNVILTDGSTHVALFQFNGNGKAARDIPGEQIFLPLVER